MQPIIDILRARRHALRMSVADVARRSKVSLPTVGRILSGRAPNASFANVLAVAKALGLTTTFEPGTTATEFREQQAHYKARQIVSMAQATSALDGQAVDEESLQAMTRQTVHELLAGSPRTLWSE
jgi:transcriptional regulator with XRE-family HTH domain